MGIFQLLRAYLSKKRITFVNFGDIISVDLPRESDVKVGIDSDVKAVLRLENKNQRLTTGLDDEDITNLIGLLQKYQKLTKDDRKRILAEESKDNQIKSDKYFHKNRNHGKEICIRIPKKDDYDPWTIQTVLLVEIENGSQIMDIGLNKADLRDITEKCIHYWHIIDRQERVLDDYPDEEGDDSHLELLKISTKIDENDLSHLKKSKSDENDDEEDDDGAKERIKTKLVPKVYVDLSYENQKRREEHLSKLHYFS